MYICTLLAMPNRGYDVHAFQTRVINAAQATDQASSGYAYLSTRAFPTKTYGSSGKSIVYSSLLYYAFQLRPLSIIHNHSSYNPRISFSVIIIDRMTKSLVIFIINQPLYILIIRAQFTHKPCSSFGIWWTIWRGLSAFLRHLLPIVHPIYISI